MPNGWRRDEIPSNKTTSKKAHLKDGAGKTFAQEQTMPNGWHTVHVADGETVTAIVNTRNVIVSLALDGGLLPHPDTGQYSLSFGLQAGDHVLVIVPVVVGQPWAFEVRLLVDAAVITTVMDQGTEIGVRPTVGVHLHMS